MVDVLILVNAILSSPDSPGDTEDVGSCPVLGKDWEVSCAFDLNNDYIISVADIVGTASLLEAILLNCYPGAANFQELSNGGFGCV